MKTIIITNIKYKQDKEEINNLLITYSFKQINNNTHIGNITQTEKEFIKKELTKKTKQKDNIIIIPLCQRCYNNITQYGTIKDLKEENYVIL